MRHGFTLVELSLVLVILGLLIGGILGGQALIAASQLRGISTESASFVSATAAFRDKYNGLPGDLRDAQSYFGVLNSTPATCIVTESNDASTCNGDGNGNLYYAPTPSSTHESFRFWQQLAAAGFITGQYTGRSDAAALGNWGSTGGRNVPTSKFPGGLWFVAFDASSGSAMFDVAITRHNLRIGKAAANTWPANTLLKPEDAWSLDTKTDDGKPATGAVTSTKNSFSAGCTDTDTTSAAYRIAQSTAQCILFFDAGF